MELIFIVTSCCMLNCKNMNEKPSLISCSAHTKSKINYAIIEIGKKYWVSDTEIETGLDSDNDITKK